MSPLQDDPAPLTDQEGGLDFVRPTITFLERDGITCAFSHVMRHAPFQETALTSAADFVLRGDLVICRTRLSALP